MRVRSNLCIYALARVREAHERERERESRFVSYFIIAYTVLLAKIYWEKSTEK